MRLGAIFCLKSCNCIQPPWCKDHIMEEKLYAVVGQIGFPPPLKMGPFRMTCNKKMKK